MQSDLTKSPISLGDTLIPSLVQCFGIIFIGYILGKTKLLKQTQAQGLSIFVQYLSLPALIFVTVSTIPFTQVKWAFIAAVFVSKTCIFVCVILITILLTHPHDLGKAGVFAIFATQSNDFAMGFPLFNALYQNMHPEYPSYIYIIAPTQLLVLNSVGFFFLESEKHNRDISKTGNYLYHVLKGTIQNPVIIMTIIGLIWNLTYGQKILPVFDNILKAFSSAFPATALLLLGYTMTLSSEKSSSQTSLVVTILIITKNLIIPLILQKTSAFFLQNSSAEEIENFSSFGFLYGILPTAPSVYVFATQYDTCIEVATKTVIGSTIFSAPLLFASSSVISLSQVGIENVTSYLSITISYLSSVNAICSLWLLIIFLSGKRWKSISFGLTFYLVFAQLLTSVGGILMFFTPVKYSILFYAQYILTSGSIYATRFCALLLAVLLLVIRIRSLCFILHMKKQINIFSILVCLLLPYALAASLIMCKNKGIYAPNYQLGFAHCIMSFTLTFACLIGTVICVILQQVYLKRNSTATQDSNYTLFQNTDSGYQNPNLSEATTSKTSCCGDIEDLGKNVKDEHCPGHSMTASDIERVCDSKYHCSAAQRFQCSVEISRYIDDNNEIGTGLIDDEYFFRHIVLLIFFGVAMTLSLFICFWKFVLEDENGIFIELEFLDIIGNYSLGIVCFIMYGLDTQLLNLVIKKFKQWSANTPSITLETIESKIICEQFLIHYYKKCKKDIEKNRIINKKQFHAVFDYAEIKTWLLESEMATTNEDAEFQIECLIKAHIIQELDENIPGKCFFRFSNIDFPLNS